jgi:hypothetical protein
MFGVHARPDGLGGEIPCAWLPLLNVEAALLWFLLNLWRIWREAKLYIELLPELFKFNHAFTQVIIFKMASCVWILILPVGVLIEVNTFEVIKVDVVNVGVFFF